MLKWGCLAVGQQGWVSCNNVADQRKRFYNCVAMLTSRPTVTIEPKANWIYKCKMWVNTSSHTNTQSVGFKCATVSCQFSVYRLNDHISCTNIIGQKITHSIMAAMETQWTACVLGQFHSKSYLLLKNKILKSK